MDRKHCTAFFLCVIILFAVLAMPIDNARKDADVEQASEMTEEKAEGDKSDGGEPVKTVYLTFDDGPSCNTREVLEILDKYNFKATFFLIGEQIDGEYVDVVKEIIDAGHGIGIHTYSHKYNQIYCSVESYIEDFDKACERISEITGEVPEIYRFPGGSCNTYIGCEKDSIINVLAGRGFTYYDWNVSGEDSVGSPTVYSIYHNVVADICNFDKPVVLLHDSAINKNTVEALPDIIEYIISEGYTSDKLPE